MKPSLQARILLQVVSRIVPAGYRTDWLAEWRGELWAVSASHSAGCFRFALGSFSDAWYLRSHQSRNGLLVMQSPKGCLASLALLAVFTVIVCPRLVVGASRTIYSKPDLVFAATVALAAGLLNCIWCWEIAVPAGARSAPGLRVRWYFFLAAKFGAVLTVAHEATVHLVVHGLPMQAVLVGCVASFLWIQREQRQRCPICLHRLARPVRIGTYAQTFLGWNGTESICLKGHGTLYTGHAGATGRESQTEWTGMDTTWADLFAERR